MTTPTPESLRAELARLELEMQHDNTHSWGWLSRTASREARRAEIRAKLVEIEAAGEESLSAALYGQLPDVLRHEAESYTPHAALMRDAANAIEALLNPTPSPAAVAELVEAAREYMSWPLQNRGYRQREDRKRLEAAIRGVEGR